MNSDGANLGIGGCHAREHPEKGLPRPTLATMLEVVIDTKVYRVEG
jgi:hypothetical protein